MVDHERDHDPQVTPSDAGMPGLDNTEANDKVKSGNGIDQHVAILKTLATYGVQTTFATKDGAPLSKAAKESWHPADDGVALDLEQLMDHAAKQKVIAAYLIAKGDDKTRIGVFDLDDHDKEIEWPQMVEAAKRITAQLARVHTSVFAVRSRRGRGIHLWMPFSGPVPAVQLRAFLQDVLADCNFKEGRSGIAKGTVEIFPKQDSLAAGSIDVQIGDEIGSHICLPFAGDSVALDPNTFEITDKPKLEINGTGTVTAFPMDDQPAPDRSQRTPIAFDKAKLREALGYLSPDGADDYRLRRAVGLAVKTSATDAGFDLEIAYKIWAEWIDTKTEAKKPLETKRRKRWAKFKVLPKDTKDRRVTIKSIYHKAREAGWIDPDEPLSTSDAKPPKWVSLSFRFSELTATPWVARHFALRRAVTHIAGIGGAGKTGFMLQAAIAFTQGEDFAGFHPMRPIKVAFVSGEEPLDELRRRIAAIVLDRVGQKQADCDAFMAKLDGKLFTFEGKNVQIVAKKIDDEDGAFVIRTPFHKELIANVKANKIDLVILDPIARLHTGLDENSAEMQELHNAADDLATQCDCGSALVHHIKKASKGTVDDQHASRGHSSMTDAARITIMMANMSKDEAKELLPATEQPHYFRYCKLGDPKQNYGINSAEKWFYKDSVELPVKLEDGSPDSRMVLKRWMPDHSAIVLLAPWLQEFLDLIHAGINGEFYRRATRGPREYRADALLEDRFNVSKQRSQLALTLLIDKGILGIEDRHSVSSRRPVPIYVVLSRIPTQDEDIPF